MLRSRYRRPGYGKFPRWAAVALGVLWLASTVGRHREFEQRAYGAEDVYMLYVDRELRLLEAGEGTSAGWRLLIGVDEPAETLADLRDALQYLAERIPLSQNASGCLGLLLFETGREEEALAILDESHLASPAGAVLWSLLRNRRPPEDQLVELRREIATGSRNAWESRVLALAEQSLGETSKAGVWTSHRALNDILLQRVQTVLLLDAILLVIGLLCLPVAIRVLRRPRPPPLARIMGRWTPSFVLGMFFAVELFRDGLAAMRDVFWSVFYSILYLDYWVFWIAVAAESLIWQVQGAVFLTLILFARPWHVFKGFGFGRPIPWSAVFAMLSILLGLFWVEDLAFDFDRVIDPTDLIDSANPTGVEWISTILSACVVAPLFEETVFRGFLFLGLRKGLGNWGALLLSTVLFAAVHWQYDLAGMISVGVFGACCGLLAWRTGSILPGIILHFTFNSLTIGTVYFVYQAPLQVPF